jgi:hypothetical protein
MTHPTQKPGEKLKKALKAFSDLVEQHPEKSRKILLEEIEIKFDLTPKECEFLNSHFDKE